MASALESLFRARLRNTPQWEAVEKAVNELITEEALRSGLPALDVRSTLDGHLREMFAAVLMNLEK